MTEDLYNRPRAPLLIVISGPSGVGKDSVLTQLRDRNSNIHFVITATNRPPRPGERHGVDYFFVSNDEFADMINNNELLEWAKVYNDFKGIPKQQVRDALDSGKDVVMRIDVQGAATIRELIPDAVLIFIMTASEAELVQRLEARKTETPEGLKMRVASARREMACLPEFDYYIINPDRQLDNAVAQLEAIMVAEHSRVHPRQVRL